MQEATQHGDWTGSYSEDSGNLNIHYYGNGWVNYDTLIKGTIMQLLEWMSKLYIYWLWKMSMIYT